MKHTLRFIPLLFIVLLFVETSHAQTTYRTEFNSADEIKDWKQFQLGKKKTGWKLEDGGVGGSKRIINYAPTGDADKDSLIDWYVSPEYDMSKGGTLDSLTYNYFTYFGTFHKEQHVGVYLVIGNQDPSMASEIIKLADLTDKYVGDAMQWSDTFGINIPAKTKPCYLAFQFIAVDGWSSISFDNLQVTVDATVSAPTIENHDLVTVYPNPAREQLHIELPKGLDQHVNIQILDQLGKIKCQQSLSSETSVQTGMANTSIVDISALTSGMYVLQIEVSGRFITHRFVKN